MRRIVRKWRPPLALVVGGTLLGVFVLPFIGLVYLRLWGNILGWGETAWLIFWLAFAATLVLGLLLWRLVLRPVYALTEYAQAMRRGHEAEAPNHFGTPELGALGQAVMAMGDSLNSRAEGLRAYADHVTHELKSPLTAIHGAAELLAPGDGQQAVLTDTIKEASDRMEVLLADLARHAQATQSVGPGQAVVSDVVAGGTWPLTVAVAQNGTVPLAPDDLAMILTQLARNAFENGAAQVTLVVAQDQLKVADDGPGISAGNRDRIFDPFFTTRRAAGGTGMGLSIVRSLVQARGGRIRLDAAQKGAVFIISFD